MALAPQLQGYIGQYEAIQSRTRNITAGLTDAQLNWRPADGRWSIAECLGHLEITEAIALSTTERLLAEVKAANLRSQGPFRQPLLGNWFTNLMEPPYRIKAKAQPNMAPPSGRAAADLLPLFDRLQMQLTDRIRACEGYDVGAVRAKVVGPVSLTLGQWFGFTAAHTRRHLWQAEQVRSDARFPA